MICHDTLLQNAWHASLCHVRVHAKLLAYMYHLNLANNDDVMIHGVL